MIDNKELLRKEYASRINRVLDFIESHLDETLTLDQLAGVANFSPFHFHRIFSSIQCETLNHFITRVRVEKAANLLAMPTAKSITEIALDCGFSGSAVFSRAFRDMFGMTPTAWRNGGCGRFRKNGQTDRKTDQPVRNTGKACEFTSMYIGNTTQTQKWRITMKQHASLEAKVEVKQLEPMTVAYVRHVGPYQGNEKLFEQLFEKLMKWAGPRELVGPDTRCLTIYHDNPDLTDDDKLRISCCITVPEQTVAEGEIGRMTIPGGRYAMAHFEIDPSQYGDAWNALYGGWLPESGYQPDDRPCFELYEGHHEEHPEGKHVVNICMPVKPL
ncbi:AraC family transcriptional regulator [bacterium]|nr:AraC family transcriptional regulator [bacterium]